MDEASTSMTYTNETPVNEENVVPVFPAKAKNGKKQANRRNEANEFRGNHSEVLAASRTTEKKKFSCDRCSFVTSYLYSFTRHRSNVHKIVGATKSGLGPTPTRNQLHVKDFSRSATTVPLPLLLPSVDTIRGTTFNHKTSEMSPVLTQKVAEVNKFDSVNSRGSLGLGALKFKTTDGTCLNLLGSDVSVGREIDDSDFLTFRKGDESLSHVDQTCGTLLYGFENSDDVSNVETALLFKEAAGTFTNGKKEESKSSVSRANKPPRETKMNSTSIIPKKSRSPKRQSVKISASKSNEASIALGLFQSNHKFFEDKNEQLDLPQGLDGSNCTRITTTEEQMATEKSVKSCASTGKPLRVNRRQVAPIVVTATVSDCPLCTFSSKYRSNTARHFQTTHKLEFQGILDGTAFYSGITRKPIEKTKNAKATNIVSKNKQNIGSSNNPFLSDNISDIDAKNNPSVLVTQNGIDAYPSAAQQLAQFVQEENLELYAADSTDNMDVLNGPLESSFIDSILSNVLGAETEEWNRVLNSGLGSQYVGSPVNSLDIMADNGNQHCGPLPVSSQVQIPQIPVSFIPPVSTMKQTIKNPKLAIPSVRNTCPFSTTTAKIKRNVPKNTSSNVKRSKNTKAEFRRCSAGKTSSLMADASTISHNQYQTQSGQVENASNYNDQLRKIGSLSERQTIKMNNVNEEVNEIPEASIVTHLNQPELLTSLPVQCFGATVNNKVNAAMPVVGVTTAHPAQDQNHFLELPLQSDLLDLNVGQSSFEQPVLTHIAEGSRNLNPSILFMPPTPKTSANIRESQLFNVPVLTVNKEAQIENTNATKFPQDEQAKLREIRNAKRRQMYHEKLKKSLTAEDEVKKSVQIQKRRESRKVAREKKILLTTSPAQKVVVSVNVAADSFCKIPKKSKREIGVDLTEAQLKKRQQNAKRRERNKLAKEQRMPFTVVKTTLETEDNISVARIDHEEMLNRQQLFHITPIQEYQAIEAFGSVRTMVESMLLPESKSVSKFGCVFDNPSGNEVASTSFVLANEFQHHRIMDIPTSAPTENCQQLYAEPSLVIPVPSACLPFSCEPAVKSAAMTHDGMYSSVFDTDVNQANNSVPTTLVQSFSTQELEVKKGRQGKKRREKQKGNAEFDTMTLTLESSQSKHESLEENLSASHSQKQMTSVNNVNTSQDQRNNYEMTPSSSVTKIDDKFVTQPTNVDKIKNPRSKDQWLIRKHVPRRNAIIRGKRGDPTKTDIQNKHRHKDELNVNAELAKMTFIKMDRPASIERCHSLNCDFATDSQYRLVVHKNFHEALEGIPLFIKSVIEATGNLG